MSEEHPSRSEIERFVDGAADADLTRRIREHLVACASCSGIADEYGDFSTTLTEPAQTPLVTPRTLPGTCIGNYVILDFIQEGGFGEVYLAKQVAPVKRERVALKMIKPGMDTREVLARFDAERQALALMEHPNIARIFDAGSTEQGRSYFVMEYVRGVPITDHCDRHRLGVEQRLDLFLQCCAAVQHAHQKGVIHRDIKPSNILVTHEGERAVPKVIDFGVAKALDRPLTEATIFTEEGRMIGTPEYMSPEQAEMTRQDIDTRSDIYSLGVVLYELLTGFLPFERRELRRGGLEGMLRIIRNVDPPRPSTKLSTESGTDSAAAVARRRSVDTRTLTRRVRGDLDWITMRCLEKDRMRRYDTAAELAADVRRHLADEPVQAGPPSAAYKMRKFARRNFAAVMSTALVGVVLLIGAVTITALGVKLRQEKKETGRVRAAELIERSRVLAFKDAEGALELLQEAAELDPGSPDADVEAAYQTRLHGQRSDAIEKTEAVLREFPDAAEAKVLLASLLRDENPERAGKLRNEARGRVSEDRFFYALAFDAATPEESIELLTRSLEAYPWSFETLWQRAARRYRAGDGVGALRDAETLVRIRPDLALTWILRGSALTDSRRYDEALETYDEAIRVEPDNWLGYYDRAWVHERMSRSTRDGAERDKRQQLALADLDRSIARDPSRHQPHALKGKLLLEKDEWTAALETLNRAVELGAEEPWVFWDRGRAASHLGDFRQAERDLSTAIEGDTEEANLVSLHYERGLARLALGELEQGREDLTESLALDPHNTVALNTMGRAFFLEYRCDRALPWFRQAVDESPEGERTAYVMARGIGFWCVGDLDAAVDDFDRVRRQRGYEWIGLWQWEIRTLGGDHDAAARLLDEISATESLDPLLATLIEAHLGNATARDVLQRVTDPREDMVARYYLGALAFARNRRDEAEQRFRECVEAGQIREIEHDLALWHLHRLEHS